MNIPFLDLKAPHVALSDALHQALERVIQSGWFINGVELTAFEAEFAEFSGAEHCIGVGNGLDGLYLLLHAHGIGPGDEVIVPSNTFIATWLAVTRCGAVPVPVEPTSWGFNIDPQRVEAAITARTRAILAVHLYGQCADMDPLQEIASRYGIDLFEDAAQAQGARYKGRQAGGLADGAATSFYPGKNLGALGDAGAVLLDNGTKAEAVRRLRNYGSEKKYRHDVIGHNSRLDELQAAFLRVKLRDLQVGNVRRRAIADYYSERLSDSGVVIPVVPDWAEPVWHLYVVRSQQRDELQQRLQARGIGTLVHYPIAPHKQACYPNYSGHDLPMAEAHAREVLSLPLMPSLSDAEVEYVAEAVRTAA